MSPFSAWIIVALVVIPIIALVVYAVLDLVRRDDLSAAPKTAWIVAVVLVPLIGGVLYLIFRPTRPEDIRGFGRPRRSERVDLLLPEDEQVEDED
jgi:hypothetical protein